MLKAKNACPKAVIIVSALKYDQFGLSRKDTPSIAPGSVSERTASAIKRINSPGIR
ncbi:Uncharacterised protein [Neisseria meningitidis]|nr:Uncharacterised protein [Neisseria meningitidis]CWR69534.1 Uncharacterised protein [Neisseria meningitidis]